ncbi:hypothetical protein J1N35_011896 [Gossypium stocksii]|uniref:Tetrapyrrole biosynthesis glutamyl-tRNA reductase dimerisation domain-containing protein n=1 Tax=Gossypium stocksii TaxID=47602 RepID=A0A9D3W4C4_9ROSI|nr:hypothetical protein J1N35_011896 [Gossypium stocksii]
MATLPTPCSLKFQPNDKPFPTLKHHKPHNIPIISSTLKTSTKSLHRFISSTDNYNPVVDSSRRGHVLGYQTSTTKGGHSSELKTKQHDEVSLEREAEIVIFKLRAVVEKLRDMEVEKINGRLKGTMSDEERLLVENTSREIADKFLKRPVEYLKASHGDFETKLKDLNLLIRMLENSGSTGRQR